MMFWINFTLALANLLNIHALTIIKKEYDYVIVGGGSSGCVLASRLSEYANKSVLVLEAGIDPIDDPFVPVPLAWYNVYTHLKNDWGFYTEPQKNSPTKKKLWFGQARMLGGSGAHNGLTYTHGSRHDFDRWHKHGNKGWDYESVLPYFKKAEEMAGNILNTEYHGTSGPIKVKLADREPMVDRFLKAAKEIGMDINLDFNQPEIKGFGYMPLAVDHKGRRSDSLTAYLRPVLARRNLEVLTEALVTKIQIKQNGKTKQAKGVHYQHNGETRYVKAKQEVIISAGAINSPKILMLSGIGPKKQLKRHGITVKANLPVGLNLQDHLGLYLQLTVNDTSPIEEMKIHTFENLFQYVFAGKGPYSVVGESGMAFFDSHSQPNKDKFPYMEYMFGTANTFLLDGKFSALQESIRNGSGVISELLKELQKADKGNRLLSAVIVHLHPRTTGKISLKSKDPSQLPKIELEYLKSQKDIDDVIKAIRMLQKLVNSQALKTGQVNPLSDDNPSCRNHKFDTDSYWECYIRHNFETFLHYSSTCKMAPDSTGVVDNQLRVKGIDGLRVADISIMPMITSGHPVAAVTMIAEKAADMIKAQL